MELSWIGETASAAAIVLDQEGEVLDAPILWTSNAPDVASVSDLGAITAVRVGETWVVAQVEELRDSVFVRVEQVVASIEIVATDDTLRSINQSTVLTAIVEDAGGTPVPDPVVVWSSSDASVAPVSNTGIVTALASGSAQIEAASGGLVAAILMVVEPTAATVDIDPSSVVLASLGETVQLTATQRDALGNPLAGDVTWTSDNPLVVEVSLGGLITSRENGSATVKASAGAAVGSVEVVVQQVATSIVVSPKSSTLSAPSAEVQLSATARDMLGVVVTNRSPTWSATPAGVVSVDGVGRVRALSNGTANVIAALDGVSDNAIVTVALPPPAPTWETLPSLPTGVFAPATATDGQRIFVFGGEDGTSRLATTQIFHIGTNSWSAGAPVPEDISWAAAAVLPDGVHLVGGVSNSSAAVTTHRIYDPATDSWNLGPPLPAPMAGGTAQFIGGLLVVAGGIDGPSSHSNNVHVFDPSTGTWSTGAPVPGARINWTSDVLGGRLYGAGGGTPPGISTGNELLSYDPGSNSWQVLTPLNQRREAHGSGVSAGRFCVFGGRIARSGNFNTPFDNMECYDPSTGVWTDSTPLPLARQALGSVTVGGYMYAIGGSDHLRRGTGHFTRFRF